MGRSVQDPQSAASPVLARATPGALRAELRDLFIKELMGPVGGPTEEISEPRVRVRERYLLGALAPARTLVMPESQDELAESDGGGGEDGAPETAALQVPTLMPSSIGLSFCVGPDAPGLRVTARWGKYQRRGGREDADEDGPAVWRRVPVTGTLGPIRLQPGKIAPMVVTADQPGVHVEGIVRRSVGGFVVTLFLVNGQEEPKRHRDEAWLFQPELIVEAEDGSPCFEKRSPHGMYPDRIDAAEFQEERTLAMLYRDRVEFAVGHGVAVHADEAPEDPCRALRVRTKVLPVWEVPRQTPPTDEEIPRLAGMTRDMKALAELDAGGLEAALGALPAAYAEWIADQRKRIPEPGEGLAGFQDEASRAMDGCDRALGRIREGIDLLRTDAKALDAFRFANRAMWYQRTRTLLAMERRRGNEAADIADVDVPKNRTWYPFQLAFVLMNLPGLTRLDHPDRTDPDHAVADLLWFPTGGGKTEAYLGLAAYVMGLRRLQGEVAGRPGQYGVAVLMRYTLRLLTLQQFQRAAALICATEKIRTEAMHRGDLRWGTEPFRLGLWVGQKTTPNWTEDADHWVRSRHGHNAPLSGSGSPLQITNCPWCGQAIDPGRNIVVERHDKGHGRTYVYCGDRMGNCPYSKRNAPDEGIPLVVVDEEIYRHLPSMVIATVDKFAQMPWNGAVQMLFGQVTGRCTRHGFVSPELPDAATHPRTGSQPAARTEAMGPLRPPDLILQDELHLISGPLGSLVGLYETVVDDLCRWEVDGRIVRPKIIASTATIRKARDQVRGIFVRDVAVFPPQGLDVGDNFFSRERTPSEAEPGRLYLGVCAPGRRMKAVLIRVYETLLSAGQLLFDRNGEIVDPWMTLVGYFNSIRELGGMRRLVDDDVASRLRSMDKRGLARRLLRDAAVEELTSRKSAEDIPKVLDRMERVFGQDVKGEGPLDVLLATNMISVGVDVRRLGMMVVAGQPKTTAEYIQATSRVGRGTPGLVVTVYNWARPRDLSHYEQFEHYHATFYQQVEALSVTPFAARAQDRGLAALLVAMIRLASPDMSANEDAQSLDLASPEVTRALQTIRDRAARVTDLHPVVEQVQARMKALLDHWDHQAKHLAGGARLGYKDRKDGKTRGLLTTPGLGDWRDFTCLTSLRDVEPGVGLILDDRDMDELQGDAE